MIFFGKSKLTLHNKMSENDRIVCLFSLSVIGFTMLYWIYTLITRGAVVSSYYVSDHANTSMDYFNMLAMAGTSDPWAENSNYPALPFLIWKVLVHMVPDSARVNATGESLRNNMLAQFGFIFLNLSCLIAIYEILKSSVKGSNVVKTLFSIALIFSGPMMFLLERGNILILSLVGLLLFITYYNSDSKKMRIIGYIGLGIAAAIKLYPAIFGLLVLRKKRYKEAGLLVLIGIVTFLVPFFAFDGFDSVRKMIEGIGSADALQVCFGFGYNFSLDTVTRVAAALLGIKVIDTPMWFILLGVLVCFFAFVFSKKEWQQLFALSLICIWYPVCSYTYVLTFFFLPIISYLNNYDSNKKKNFITLALFTLMMIPYGLSFAERVDIVAFPYNPGRQTSWGQICIFLTIGCMLLLILIDVIMNLIKNKKPTKNHKIVLFRN